MIVVRSARLAPWIFLLVVPLLSAAVLLSLPVFLGLFFAVFGIKFMGHFLFPRKNFKTFGPSFGRIFRGPSAFSQDSSTVISNSKIGNYRIKQDPRDPQVIEVIES